MAGYHHVGDPVLLSKIDQAVHDIPDRCGPTNVSLQHIRDGSQIGIDLFDLRRLLREEPGTAAAAPGSRSTTLTSHRGAFHLSESLCPSGKSFFGVLRPIEGNHDSELLGPFGTMGFASHVPEED